MSENGKDLQDLLKLTKALLIDKIIKLRDRLDAKSREIEELERINKEQENEFIKYNDYNISTALKDQNSLLLQQMDYLNNDLKNSQDEVDRLNRKTDKDRIIQTLKDHIVNLSIKLGRDK